MRAWLVAIVAGCGGAAEIVEPDVVLEQIEPEPRVAFALVPGASLSDQISTFTTGARPMTFAASAPRAAQLIVWGSLHRDQRVDPSFCPHLVHRFDRGGTAAITLGFDWNPKPGNTVHRYTIDLAGDAVSADLANPQHPVGAVDRGAIPDGEAAAGVDYLLFAWATDPDKATTFDTLDQAVQTNDRVVAIRARFVAPRERPVAFDADRCAPAD